VATTIRTGRTARGLTLEQLAFLSDLSFAYLSRLERGLSRLTPEAAERLGRALGVSPEALLAGQEQLRASLRRKLEVA
jgi:transcriptional regulator with XRE-family HTH domain